MRASILYSGGWPLGANTVLLHIHVRTSAYMYVPACILLIVLFVRDEADLLGDRIAIMGDGRLICSGSSLFLKSKCVHVHVYVCATETFYTMCMYITQYGSTGYIGMALVFHH